MSDVLHAKVRTEVGTNAVKRVRRAGNVPAILYGHGKGNVNLAVVVEDIKAALRHGAQMVTLDGDVNETALIREVQWDAFGIDVLHLDLTRVSASEEVQVTVPLELRGESPGIKEGGIVELLVHEVEINCPAASIPEKLGVRVHDLHLDGSIKLAEVPLPEGASLVSDPDKMVVHCVSRMEDEEEEAVAGEGIEPEVIGSKAEDDEEGS